MTRNILFPCIVLGSFVFAGCATWTGPKPVQLPTTQPDADAAFVRPSQQQRPVVRGQQPIFSNAEPVPGSQDQYHRTPMTASGVPRAERTEYAAQTPSGSAPENFSNTARSRVQPAQYDAVGPIGGGSGPPGPNAFDPLVGPPIGAYGVPAFPPGPSDMPGTQPFTGRYADVIVNVREQQTGRFMFGVGVNSEAGLTAQIVIDEYNFDWRRFPRSIDDVLNGYAWRGGGQRLRIEAIPGSELQRYLVNFTEPYLFDTNISLNLSGFLYDRRYFDWDEQRLGGRIGLGYRLTPDVSLSTGLRLENVNLRDPRVRGIPELEEALGDSSLFSGRVTLTHDTRDSPFAPTEGHLLELTYEQVFGSFDYPRGIVDYRRYFLLSQRPDQSGRHVLGASFQTGISGSQTPVYENFFAGGYSTLRGFRFRSAAPKVSDVYVGGELSLLGSVEYIFPISADDMLKGVVFCDYGTIEEEIEIDYDDFRVAVGAGLRITVPAMGPAPIALDLAVPLAREQTDRIQNFSFFVGFGR